MNKSLAAALILLLAAVTSSYGQVVANTNQIEGVVELTNTSPEILQLFDFRSGTARAASTLAPYQSSSSGLILLGPQKARYELTVEAGPAGAGKTYAVSALAIKNNSGNQILFMTPQTSPPIEQEPAPNAVVDLRECMGAVLFRWFQNGQPVVIDRATLRAHRISDSGGVFNIAVFDANGVPNRSQHAVLLRGDNSLHQITIDLQRGTDRNLDTLRYRYTFIHQTQCDELITVDQELPAATSLGAIRGQVDMVGEEETINTVLVAYNGPFGNDRSTEIPPPLTGGTTATLGNVAPSNFSSPPSRYSARIELMGLRRGDRYQAFQSPGAGGYLVEPGGTYELGNTFVMQPAYLSGSLQFLGPPPIAGQIPRLQQLRRSFELDQNQDGITDDIAMLNWSRLSVAGSRNNLGSARTSTFGGGARGDFAGGYDVSASSWLGNYELVLGGLFEEGGYWTTPQPFLRFYDGVQAFQAISFSDRFPQEVPLPPGAREVVDLHYCFSEVDIDFFRQDGLFYSPAVNGTYQFLGTDFLGRATDRTGTISGFGRPLSSSPANRGKVSLVLPEGRYTLNPTMWTISPTGGQSLTSLSPLNLEVGCAQRLTISPEISLSLSAPRCVSTSPAAISGRVTATAAIASVVTTTPASSTLCSNCGANPAFSGTVDLAACSNSVAVKATDILGNFATAEAITVLDNTPPSFQGCHDVEATVAAGTTSAEVAYPFAVSDNCSANPALTCDIPSGSSFPVGTTLVTCSAVDECQQSSSCQFRVTVTAQSSVPESSVTCSEEGFEAALPATYQLSTLGDAGQPAARTNGGRLELQGTGSDLYHDDDNGVFYWREATGDFRYELDLAALPINTGGAYRKAGLMVRTSGAPQAARVMVQFIPDFPGGPALQFDARPQQAGPAFELASTMVGLPLPLRLAVVRRGNTLTALYSTNGGATWTQPLGGLGGSIEGDFGPSLQVGASVTSYDPNVALTASFDHLELCTPSTLGNPPVVTTCGAFPLDLFYLVDTSGSMKRPHGTPDNSKLDSVREALLTLQQGLALRGDSSRAALWVSSGTNNAAANLATAGREVVGLNSGHAAVLAAIASIDEVGVPEMASSPAAISLSKLRQAMEASATAGRRPVLVWAADSLPNVDAEGLGPAAYSDAELQQIVLRDGSGNWLDVAQVVFQGNFNPLLLRYDGQPVADAMIAIAALQNATQAPLLALVPRGDDLVTPYLREDLLAWAADWTGGGLFGAVDRPGLVAQSAHLLTALACGNSRAGVAGRVFLDLNSNGNEDAGESGIAGLTVEIRGGAGAVLAQVVTDSQGNYEYQGAPGNLSIALLTRPLGPQTYETDGSLDGTVALTLLPWQNRGGISFGFAPEAVAGGCIHDAFEDGSLDAQWTLAAIGDAAPVRAFESDGRLELEGDGSSLYAGADAAGFLYRRGNGGDFRAELELTGFSLEQGGVSRKAGLMVRSGLGDRDPRVFVDYLPGAVGGPLLQFRYRTTAGGAGDLAFGSNIKGLSLPLRLAIEKIGNRIVTEYSTDHGATWKRPAGGAGGSVLLDLGNAPLIGPNVSANDAALALRARFDEFELCQP